MKRGASRSIAKLLTFPLSLAALLTAGFPFDTIFAVIKYIVYLRVVLLDPPGYISPPGLPFQVVSQSETRCYN
jgi:hypothetical protein